MAGKCSLDCPAIRDSQFERFQREGEAAMANPFDTLADRYDAWFESERGRPIFAAEVECLRRLLPPAPGVHRLEVGVGTGRFAQALEISDGVDPSAPALRYAAARGIRVCQGLGEALPYRSAVFDSVLMVVTVCFLQNPIRGMAEVARVLHPGGVFAAGLVPRESAWGRLYRKKRRRGHPFYGVARFYAPAEIVEMARAARMELVSATATLLAPPENPAPESGFSIRTGLDPAAGFSAMLFRRIG